MSTAVCLKIAFLRTDTSSPRLSVGASVTSTVTPGR